MQTPKRRYHVDISFIRNPRNLGLFNLYQLFDFACSSDYIMPEHRQPCNEITYIMSGEGTIFVNQKPYSVEAGMLFLVKQADTHAIHSSKDNPLRYMGVAFNFNKDDPLYDAYSDINSFFENLENPISQDIYNIPAAITAAISEVSTPHFLSMEMVRAHMIQIIISAYRSFHDQPFIHYSNLLNQNHTNPLVYEIVNYIDMNLTNISRMTELSKNLGYSYGYLSKLFSKNMNITIKGYYNQKRFEKAAELLRGDVSVTEISERLGYADIQSFCKAFKKYYQISPSEYRALVKG